MAIGGGMVRALAAIGGGTARLSLLQRSVAQLASSFINGSLLRRLVSESEGLEIKRKRDETKKH